MADLNKKYWHVYVDDESERTEGPFDTYDEAFSKVGGYHASKKATHHDFMTSLQGQIDGSFVIWNCHRPPTYEDCCQRLRD